MKTGKRRRKYDVYLLIANIITFVFTGVILAFNDYSRSMFLPLAPVFFLVWFNFIYIKLYDIIGTLTGVLFFGGFYIRMVLSPLLLTISDYAVNHVNQKAMNYMNEAVALIIYEYSACLIFFLGSKKVKAAICTPNMRKTRDEHTSLYTKGIVYILIGILILTIIRYPSYLLVIGNVFEYFTFTGAQRIAKSVSIITMREETSRILYQLFSLCVIYIQVLFPAYLLSKYSELKIRSDLRRSGKRNGVLFTFFVLILSFCVLTEDLAKSAFLAVAIIYAISSAYPRKMKRFIPVLVIGGGIVVFLLLVAKAYASSDQNIGIKELSKLVNAYFAGVANTSCGIGVEYKDKFMTFFADVVRSIPLLAHFFVHLTRSQDLYNNFLYGFSGRTDQIMPMICYGYQYLGLFAPLFSVLFYGGAFSYEKKFRETDSIFNKIVYGNLIVNFAVYPAMYMLTSGISIFIYSIFFDIIVKFNKKSIEKTAKLYPTENIKVL